MNSPLMKTLQNKASTETKDPSFYRDVNPVHKARGANMMNWKPQDLSDFQVNKYRMFFHWVC